jgi:hypothetical protein
MQLAARDSALHVLVPEQLEHMQKTIDELVQGLAHDVVAHQPRHSTKNPAAGTLLSIAGRGPLDEVAARMLVQLLDHHPDAARLVRHGDVSRTAIENFDASNVSMVCIACLDIGDKPAYMRYLIQRLRRKLPQGTPILVGLWPADKTTRGHEDMRQNIGADGYATSFDEVLKRCQALLQP